MHVGVHDQTAAIGSLPAPPGESVGPANEAATLAATGTDGPQHPASGDETTPREVPTMVPRGAENGAERLASAALRIAPNCTEEANERNENGDPKIAVNPNVARTFRTEQGQSASRCTSQDGGKSEVHPRGFEPLTFGFAGSAGVGSPAAAGGFLFRSIRSVGLPLEALDGYANLGNYPPFLKKHELYFSQGIVWDKQHPVLTRKDFMGAFEICFYGWRLGAGHQFFGPNNATDLWHVKKVNPQSMVHLTEKPVELATRAIQFSSRAGENVLDLFGGSGSTLIACEQTSRKAFLMELDPLYCDVIVQRWEQFTGKQAQRQAAV